MNGKALAKFQAEKTWKLRQQLAQIMKMMEHLEKESKNKKYDANRWGYNPWHSMLVN